MDGVLLPIAFGIASISVIVLIVVLISMIEVVEDRRQWAKLRKWDAEARARLSRAAPMEIDEDGNLYRVDEKPKPITKASRWKKGGDET